jgi:hypothetical protein
MKATQQLTMFGLKSELVTQKKNDAGAVSMLTLAVEPAKAYGYKKAVDGESDNAKAARLESNREAKAARLADALEVDNLIAEKGIPAIVDLQKQGRIRFAKLSETKGGLTLTMKKLSVREVKVPAKLTDAQVTAWLAAHPEFKLPSKTA